MEYRSPPVSDQKVGCVCSTSIISYRADVYFNKQEVSRSHSDADHVVARQRVSALLVVRGEGMLYDKNRELNKVCDELKRSEW